MQGVGRLGARSHPQPYAPHGPPTCPPPPQRAHNAPACAHRGPILCIPHTCTATASHAQPSWCGWAGHQRCTQCTVVLVRLKGVQMHVGQQRCPPIVRAALLAGIGTHRRLQCSWYPLEWWRCQPPVRQHPLHILIYSSRMAGSVALGCACVGGGGALLWHRSACAGALAKCAVAAHTCTHQVLLEIGACL